MSKASPTRTPITRASQYLFALTLLSGLLVPASLSAQSCILTRLDSPVLNAFNGEFGASELQRWQATLGYRYGYSFRHFRGSHEEPHRVEEHSQVVNNVNLLDVAVRYRFDDRNSLSVGLPFLDATRDGGLRDDNRVVVQRYERSHNTGIGDMTAIFNHLLWDPATHRRSNLSLGVGIKFPTGDHDQEQTRLRFDDDGNITSSTSVADFSVQPGDGAWGLIAEASGYKLLNQTGSLAFYGSGTYIIQPQTDNGVLLDPDDLGEEYVSASDQYVGRLGFQLGPHSWRGVSVGLGVRVEGVPVHDLVGSSRGRRRPGYMASVEPSLSWTHKKSTFSLAVPIAVERNRQRSVADMLQGSAGGDAAFPDYLVLTSYSVSF